jgi:hypothetical protein
MVTAFTEVFRAINGVITFAVDTIIAGPINFLIEALNKFTGTEITPLELAKDGKFNKALDEFAAGARETTVAVARQFKDLVTAEWPIDKAVKFYAAVQEAAQNAALVVEGSRRKMQTFGEGGDTEAAEKEREKFRERLAGQLELLREHAMTEEELENARHASRLQTLNAALANELISLRDAASVREGLEQRHMEALAKIRQKGLKRVKELSVSSVASGVKQITGQLASLTANAARENKTMFDVHKAFAISDALVSGAMGVAQTLGAYPFPINAIFAGAHAAVAAAQVGVIAAQQFEGGGRRVAAPTQHVGIPSGGTPAAAAAGAGGGISGGQNQLLQINLQGDTFSRGTVLSLIEGINEAVGDGARIEIE